jgi:ubiquinone/menaquinone biosynthesis C-methylase UbiE
MTSNTQQVEKFYDENYHRHELQRHYPNEQLVRFISRTFSEVNDRSKIKILEIGCGSGANTWFLCNEGFDVFSIDISEEGIKLTKECLLKWNKKANITKANMLDLPFEDNYFDCVIDIFSSNCLTNTEFDVFINKIYKILKKEGTYFSYTPSKKSDAYINYLPATKIDSNTLNGIYRQTSPFFGNYYSFRFEDPYELKSKLENAKLNVYYLETIGQTYRTLQEYFEFVTISGKK